MQPVPTRWGAGFKSTVWKGKLHRQRARLVGRNGFAFDLRGQGRGFTQQVCSNAGPAAQGRADISH